MKKFRFLLNPFIILFFVNLIFFFPLFFPHLKLIITPEYGGGDENIFHYPIKFLFQQKIKEGELLIWAKNMGGGYPAFAFGEVGLLNPLNIITLLFFPFTLAINLQIFLLFLILLFSTYWLGRVLNFSKNSAIFLSTTFTYSFFVITNIIHISHLASFIYVPALFAITIMILRDKPNELINYLILIVLLFLQIISGHLQYFFYSLLLIYGYIFSLYCFSKKENKKNLLNKTFFISCCLIFTLCLSAFQLIPAIEYYKFSNRALVSSSLSLKNLSLQDLLTFFYPFTSYNKNLLKYSNVNSFVPPWDSNFYFGILPLLILFLGFFFYKKTKIINYLKENKQFIFLLIFFILIAFGQNSPFYFINATPPFSLFRVPERITFLILMIITIFVTYIFNNFSKSKNKVIKTLLILAIVINFISNMILMYKFQVFINPKEYFNKNSITSFLIKDRNKRFMSLFFYDEIIPLDLFNNGIDRINNSNFKIVKNSEPQNLNLIFNLDSLNLPTSAFNLNRHYYFYSLLFAKDKTYLDRQETKTASLSASASNLFKLGKVSYLLSPYKIIDPQNSLDLIKNRPIYIYQTKASNNKFSFSNKPVRIFNLKEFEKHLETLDKNNTAFVESDYPGYTFKSQKNIEFDSEILIDKDTYLKAQIKANTDGILTLAENYYPGWKAYIDSKQVDLFRSNFLYKGLYYPKGKHLIEYKYQPASLKIGIIVSLLFFVGIIMIIIICLKKYPHCF